MRLAAHLPRTPHPAPGKRAGDDRRFARQLDAHLAHSPPVGSASSLGAVAASPFGPLSESSNRKTFIDLASLLNTAFPDYDFSGLRVDQFAKEPSALHVRTSLNAALAEASARIDQALLTSGSFVDALWAALEDVIEPSECDIYSYEPDFESDPFSEEGCIWSLNYLFYNRSLKKIAFLMCRRAARSSHAAAAALGMTGVAGATPQFAMDGLSSASDRDANDDSDADAYYDDDDDDDASRAAKSAAPITPLSFSQRSRPSRGAPSAALYADDDALDVDMEYSIVRP